MSIGRYSRLKSANPTAVIVGCGNIAGGYNHASAEYVLTHAVAYRRQRSDIVGCCDIDADRAESFARRWEIETHGTDLQRILDQTQPDIVSLCTPPHARRADIETILNADSVRVVLIEKPIADSAEEADAVRDLLESSDTHVIINYFRAFDPFYRWLEQATQQQKWGAFRSGTARYYGPAVTNASHFLERLLAMFGEPAALTRLGGTDEAPLLEAGFERGPVLFLPTESLDYCPFEMDLFFEAGRVRVVDAERRVELYTSGPDSMFPGYANLLPETSKDFGEPSHEGIYHTVQAAINASRGEPSDPHMLERAVNVTKILDSIGAISA